MKFGLDKRHLDFILQVLKDNIPQKDAKFYIFGSRAKENYKEYSDVDIAVKLPDKKLSADILGKILLEFNDSTLPYEVDVIDLNAIDEKFKSLIKNSLVELF